MRLVARLVTLVGIVAGLVLLNQAYQFHRDLGPIIRLPFVFFTGAVGSAILLVSIYWFWRLGRDPHGERATEQRFRKRFHL